MKITAALLLGLVLSPLQAGSWSARDAAAYLDQRAAWWTTWKIAARDHETFCISCHTALPYALGRPALRTALGETAPSPSEKRLLDNVSRRVTLWDGVLPFYNDAQHGAPKSAEARATEAVLNALILAAYDARAGDLKPVTRQAFSNMWSLQLKNGSARGAWSWLNFANQPWEAPDSQYWGAALAAIAVGAAPGGYRSQPEIQENIKLLCAYLSGEQRQQSLLNRVVLLWASAALPGILRPEVPQSIIDEVFDKQRQDGGWSTTSLLSSSWKRHDGTPLEVKSDAYATGLVAYAFEQAGIPRTDGRLARALSWLAGNQDPATGLFPAYSPNKQRDPASDPGRFMSDAATAYAVLALTNGN